MINLEELRKKYADFTGIELHNEEGDALDFYRKYNEVIKPVVGKWHENPIPLTAVKKPFCGVATIDITVLSSPDKWEGVRDRMNEFATTHNGTSFHYTDNDNMSVYSVSYNCQTCGVISRVFDVGVGVGEVFELNQQISLIIIESGVSAYDTHLYIDGFDVPFLSLVETKTHTTSMVPSKDGVVQSVSEQEAYGIDLIVPYMNDELGRMLRDVIDRSTGNEAHCVVLDVGGNKSCHIMQIAQAVSNVQPPQNIGINFSMVELQPDIAKYNGLWQKQTLERDVVFFYIQELINHNVEYPPGQEHPPINNVKAVTIFWGDGTSNHYTDEDGTVAVHIYTDGVQSHEVLVFVTPLNYYRPIKPGDNLFGKDLYLIAPKDKTYSLDFSPTGVSRVFFSGDFGNFRFFDDTHRIGYELEGTRTRFYIDRMDETAKYYVNGVTKHKCILNGVTNFVDETINIVTRLFDDEVCEVVITFG